MMTAIVLGSICLLLVVALVVVIIILTARSAARKRRVMDEGEPVVGFIVQANNVLWERGTGDNAAQILISFDPDLADDPDRMLRLARKLGRLKPSRRTTTWRRRSPSW